MRKEGVPPSKPCAWTAVKMEGQAGIPAQLCPHPQCRGKSPLFSSLVSASAQRRLGQASSKTHTFSSSVYLKELRVRFQLLVVEKKNLHFVKGQY